MTAPRLPGARYRRLPRPLVGVAASVVVVVAVLTGCSSTSDVAGVRRRPAAPGPTVTAPAVGPSTTVPEPVVPAPASTAPVPTTGTTAAPPAPGRGELQRVVDVFTAAQPVPFSVVVVDLATGSRAAHLAGRQVLSASLYKLFVARELLRRVHEGSLSREAPSGAGAGRSVGECIRLMIVVSDDPCGQAGLDLVGRQSHDAALRRDGFAGTRLGTPQRTTADDVALFLRRARDGSLLGPGGEQPTAELYGLLRAQQIDDRLPRGLPPGTPVAHKTGDRTGWAHDAGVVSAPAGDLLVVALSGPWPAPCCHAERPGRAEEVAFAAIADLAARLFAAFAR